MESFKTNRIPVFSIALLSAAALSYEILLMKLFSFIYWHHFAYMIISIALLGYGASGTFLALFYKTLSRNFLYAYIANIFLFGLFCIGSFLAAQQIPFNPLEIFFDYRQLLFLFFIYIIVTLPFFFAANAIGLALSYFKEDISKIYRSDLIGAGIGSLGVIGLIYYLFPSYILQMVCALGFIAAAAAVYELKPDLKKLKLFFLMPALLALFLPDALMKLNPNQYKDLSQTMKIKGSQIIEQFPSPFGTVTIVKNDEVPFRYAPGLSLSSLQEPLPQLGIFTNGNGMSPLTKYPEVKEQLSYLDYQTSALPYHMKKAQNVLIIGAGGGSDILQSLYHNTKNIDAVELNPVIVDIVKNRYKDYAGGIYSLNNVNIHTAEAREFIASAQQKYDLIQLSLVESFGASAASLHSTNENYLYTVESIQKALLQLNPNGYLSLTRWMKLPPADTIKLFATILQALEENKTEDPRKNIMVIRNWQTCTIAVKNTPFTNEEINKAKKFNNKRFFDLSYYHGIKPSEVNRYNILEKPFIFNAVKSLLRDRKTFYENYKFNIEPPYDNKPYFYHNFKLETLYEILSLKDQGSFYLMEWGYIILLGSFLQAVIASMILIIIPLFKYKKSNNTKTDLSKKDIIIYFLSLGAGFLFIEIYFIQKFILFIGDPVISAAVVISSFLIFAGLGSGYSKYLCSLKGFKRTVRYSVFAIFILGTLYAFTLDHIFYALLSQNGIVKITISIIIIAPLAFFMGFPFPLGLSQLGENSPHLIPWAWGINGSASVISVIAASLISINFGFTALISAALFFYMAAYLFFPKSGNNI
ncbi:MAG: SAM-dependent methyltransferase [Campylobacterota bacterium]|nr:SAM-dependent methyltransferase [Campylobacterota bacterium]